MAVYTVGKKTINPVDLGKEMAKIIKRFDKESKAYGDKVIHHVGVNMLGQIIEDTPVGDFDPEHMGILKGNWIVTVNRASSALPNKRAPRRTRKGISSKVSKKMVSLKRSTFLTNNSEYVNVVEFGGYPVPVKRGTWNKRKKAFEIRSSKGFSKQAPKGMVRKNTGKFKRFLRQAKRAVA